MNEDCENDFLGCLLGEGQQMDEEAEGCVLRFLIVAFLGTFFLGMFFWRLLHGVGAIFRWLVSL